MRRARAEDSFTWQPLDNGLRRRVAALVAVGLCSGFAGVAVGRMSVGAGVDGSHTPAIARPNDQIAEKASAPTQAAPQKNHPASPPASPPVVLLNPNSGKQAGVEEKNADEARPLLHQPASRAAATSEQNNREVSPAKGFGRPRREQSRTHRAPVTREVGHQKAPRSSRPERPSSLADYGALREYMLRD